MPSTSITRTETGRGANLRSYIVDPGSYQETFNCALPPGTDQAEWVDPATGAVIGARTCTHSGGSRPLTPPAPYRIDIALRVKNSL